VPHGSVRLIWAPWLSLAARGLFVATLATLGSGRGWLGAGVGRHAAGRNGRCASSGGFLSGWCASTAGFLTLQFKPQSREARLWLLTINYAKKLQLLGTFVTRFCGSQVAESIGKAGSINNFQCLWANLVLCPPTFFEAEDFVY